MKNCKKIFFSAIVLLLPLLSAAQCSVCTAGIASNAESSGSIAHTINPGILYLLTVTYLIFTSVAVYFLRNHIKYYFRVLVERWRMFIASR